MPLVTHDCACGLAMVLGGGLLLCAHCDYPCSRRGCDRCSRIRITR